MTLTESQTNSITFTFNNQAEYKAFKDLLIFLVSYERASNRTTPMKVEICDHIDRMLFSTPEATPMYAEGCIN